MTRLRPSSAVKILAVVTILFGTLFALIPAASAQGEEGAKIRAQYKDEAGDNTPATGTVIVLLDENGDEVGRGEIGEDGTVELPAPGPGDYSVLLEEDTLPEGVALRNADNNPLAFNIAPGGVKNGIFALELGEGGGGGSSSRGTSFTTSVLRLSFDGLKFGLIIAMCSIGLSLIYGTTGLTNFAHGELVTFGALTTLFFNEYMHLILAAILAVVITAGFGLLNERTIWRPLRRRGTGLIAMLVISIGLSILLRYIMLFFAGGNRATYNSFGNQPSKSFGPILYVSRDLWVMAIAVISLCIVAYGVLRTRTGKAMRAVADNRDLAESSGIDVQRVIQTVWISGGALAGLGGVLFGLDQGARWDMGFELLLLMFAAVTLGGLGTAFGPLLGSILIGLLINVSTVPIPGIDAGLPAELKNVGALFVLVGILLLRPQGILGRADRIG